MSVLEEAVNKVSGNSPRIEIRILEFLGEPSEKKSEEKKKKVQAKEAMRPVIDKVIDIFGGNVVRDLTEDIR